MFLRDWININSGNSESQGELYLWKERYWYTKANKKFESQKWAKYLINLKSETLKIFFEFECR
jgi:hypothetical protein